MTRCLHRNTVLCNLDRMSPLEASYPSTEHTTLHSLNNMSPLKASYPNLAGPECSNVAEGPKYSNIAEVSQKPLKQPL